MLIEALPRLCYGDCVATDSPFADPADHPRSSTTPDMAALLDRPVDVLRELLAAELGRWKDLPRTMAAFHTAVTGIAVTVFEAAVKEGILEGWMPPARGGLELLARVLADVIDAGRPGDRSRMEAEAIDFAIGTGVQQGISEREIAEFHGVKKATISKRAVHAKERYSLPPSRGMKSEAAVEVYREMATGRRRSLREKWSFSGLLSRALK